MINQKTNELSNVQIVLLAIFDLGGETNSIDIEDIAIKVYEYAPEKFSWRKYKDKIDLRVVTYAIKDAMKPKRGPSLVSGNYSHVFMLTADGFSLVKSLATTSESIKSSSYRNRSIAEKLILEKNRLASSTAYIKYISGESENITFGDFQDFARVNEYFPAHALQRRYALISNVVRDDEKLESCWQFLQEKFVVKKEKDVES